MINQNTGFENTQNQFSNAFKELQLGKLLRKVNVSLARVFNFFHMNKKKLKKIYLIDLLFNAILLTWIYFKRVVDSCGESF